MKRRVSDRPNLLFLFTDEQRADTLEAYGNAKIQMPNLNRLARESTVFERAYCTQPVCTASRSSILTGLYPHTNGCWQNNRALSSSIPCLPEMLARRDWATAYHGKWHLGDEIFAQHGFDEWVSVEDFYRAHYSPGRDRNARSSYHHHLLEKGFQPDRGDIFSREYAARLPEEFGKPAFLAREASRFIRQHQADPFILYVNFLEPHMPFFGPRDNQYDPNEVSLPANFNHPPTATQHLKSRLIHHAYHENGFGGLPLKTEAEWRRLIANYWGLNSLVDTHVGTILATLEECGLTENTIIVYTSDHGDMMGSHRMLAKCVMFEEAIHVPLLIHLPGQTRQQRISQAVSQIDLVPTLLDVLGQPIPPALQGKSRKSELECKLSLPAEDIFVEWSGTETGSLERYINKPLTEPMAGIATQDELKRAVADPIRTVLSTDGWKLNLSQMGQHELYRHDDDPWETENLGTRPEMQAKIDEMSDKIREWQYRSLDRIVCES